MQMKRSILVISLCGGFALAVPAHAEQASAPAVNAQSAAAAGQGPQAGTSMSETEKAKKAGEILRQMLSLDVANSMASRRNTGGFAGEMSRLAFENVYMQLWTRPGLSLKERSLVTISMLIGLGNEKELAGHFASGLRNGLSPQELEEVIYHASAYAGFPRASAALAIAREVVASESAVKK